MEEYYWEGTADGGATREKESCCEKGCAEEEGEGSKMKDTVQSRIDIDEFLEFLRIDIARSLSISILRSGIPK